MKKIKKETQKKTHTLQEVAKNPLKLSILFALVAFIFAFAARLYWYIYALGHPDFFYAGEVMINTNDGYYYAEGARDLLAGSHETGDRSAVEEPVAMVTMILAKLLPFVPFETLILFMPAVFGALITVPIVFIGRALDRPLLGFLAAIIASVTYSYYNRTMTGYYDSDMLALPLPMFVLWFLLEAIAKNRIGYYLALLTALALAHWGYPQSFTLLLGTLGLAFFYVLFTQRQNRELITVLGLGLVAISGVPLLLKLPFVLVIAVFIKQKQEVLQKFFWLFAVVLLGIFGYFGGFDILINSVKAYILKDSLVVASKLKYYDVVQTVREAGHVDFGVFAARISGTVVALFLSVAGYVLLIKEKKVFLLSLPMAVLGFLAMKAGLRFTVYAVPVMAFGFGYLALFLASKVVLKPAKVFIVSFFMFISLAPNIFHIYDYKSATVYTKSEAEATAKLGKIAGREDYVYTWWDYGYPVRYYANVKNHSDGGKHDGATNFIESSILCSNSQTFAANMMRDSTERFEELIKKNREQNTSTLEYAAEQRGFKASEYEKYLAALDSKEFKNPPKTRDIYLYLPYQMIEIFPTIKMFSNINLANGEQKGESQFYFFEDVEVDEDGIMYGGRTVLDKKEMKLSIGGKKVNVAKFAETKHAKDGKMTKSERLVDANGKLNAVYLASQHALIVADDAMFNSVFVQLFMLENYDKSLFEPVIMSSQLKIYKLKI